MNKPFIITIVGSESSGKTTLAMDLAAHFECLWMPEYAREYLSSLGRPYDENDLEIIAEKQLEAILALVSRVTSTPFAPNPLMLRRPTSSFFTAQQPGTNNVITSETKSKLRTLKSKIENRKSKIIFVDGGMMNLRIWARIKFRKTIPLVEKALTDDITDLYLLCRPHKEWSTDALREAPEILGRVWIYNQYLDELVRGERPVEIVRGKKEKKLIRAIRKINFLMHQD